MSKEARLKLWMYLGTGLVLAVAAWLGATASRRGDEANARPAGEVVRLKVIDQGGAPVPQAALFTQVPAGSPPAHRGRWSSKEAVLTVPKEATPLSVSIQARGFRSTVVEDLAEDRTVVLELGLLVKLKPAPVAAPPPEPYRLVFQVSPAPRDPAALSPEQREAFVELIDTRNPASASEPALPRSEVGFAVFASAAADGILLPLPGRFLVRWGLFDPEHRVLYSLQDAAAVTIGVQNDERTQVFEIPVTADDLRRTRGGLAERVAALGTD